MKIVFLLLFSCVACNVYSQTTNQDVTKSFSSPDRKAILLALKQKLQPESKVRPMMVVDKLVMKSGFAYFHGRAKDSLGKDIDFTKTAYKQAVKDGLFDGDTAVALLKKTAGKWKVLTHVIGPTDVAWACWWKDFKAPKELFDYAESCQ